MTERAHTLATGSFKPPAQGLSPGSQLSLAELLPSACKLAGTCLEKWLMPQGHTRVMHTHVPAHSPRSSGSHGPRLCGLGFFSLKQKGNVAVIPTCYLKSNIHSPFLSKLYQYLNLSFDKEPRFILLRNQKPDNPPPLQAAGSEGVKSLTKGLASSLAPLPQE